MQPVLLGMVISAPLECHCHSHAPAQTIGHKAQAGALSRGRKEWSGRGEERKSAGELRMSPKRPGGRKWEPGGRELSRRETTKRA